LAAGSEWQGETRSKSNGPEKRDRVDSLGGRKTKRSSNVKTQVSEDKTQMPQRSKKVKGFREKKPV